MTWSVYKYPKETHVVPDDDTHEHRHSVICGCRPQRLDEAPEVVVHNAYDRRELYEPKSSSMFS